MSNVWNTLLLTVQMLSAIVMIGLILVQHGKGADMGAAFGSGSSGSLFGASGSANFLSRTTGVLAAMFLASTLILAYLNGVRPDTANSVLERAATPATAPAQPTSTVPMPAAIPGSASSGAQAIPVAPAAVPASPAAPVTAPASAAK